MARRADALFGAEPGAVLSRGVGVDSKSVVRPICGWVSAVVLISRLLPSTLSLVETLPALPHLLLSA